MFGTFEILDAESINGDYLDAGFVADFQDLL